MPPASGPERRWSASLGVFVSVWGRTLGLCRCAVLGPLARPARSPVPQHILPVQLGETGGPDRSAPLRLLGYMDTLVHFGRFALAVLEKSKMDSCHTGN